jgi:hypothetical protein
MPGVFILKDGGIVPCFFKKDGTFWAIFPSIYIIMIFGGNEPEWLQI